MLPLLVGAQALVVAPPAAGQDAIRSLMTKHDPILLYVSKLLEPDGLARPGRLGRHECERRPSRVADFRRASGQAETL